MYGVQHHMRIPIAVTIALMSLPIAPTACARSAAGAPTASPLSGKRTKGSRGVVAASQPDAADDHPAGLAIAAPRIQTSPWRREVEVEPGFTSAVYEALVKRGYRTTSRVADLTFGAVHAVHAVHVRRDGRRIGIADPRRDGSAVAQ